MLPAVESAADLRQELYARTQEAERPPDLAADPSRKWLLASALQKAIRRGHADLAIRYALKLHSIDEAYVWRRLCVIALEDVGFGDPLSAAITLEAGHSHRFRQQLGERITLATVVQSLAEATGSRLICHLTIMGAGQSNHTSSHGIAALQQPHEAPWLVAYLALRNHGGMKPFVIPAWELIVDIDDIEVKTAEDPYGDELIGQFLAASFDMFTGEGKRAARYLTKCPPFRTMDVTPDQISMAIWFAQSEIMHRSLTCDVIENVEQQAMKKDLASVGLTDTALIQLVRQHLGLANYARRRILG